MKWKIDINIVRNYGSAITAGILIGLGVIINTLMINPIIGACLFSFGLLTIIELKLPLYTGRIGFQKDKGLLDMLINNFIGIGATVFLYTLAQPTFATAMQESAAIKFSKGYVEIFIFAIFCGALVHFAVKAKQQIITVMAVMIFILIGAEHCIADLPYVFFHLDISTVGKFILVIIGNSLGAILIERLINAKEIE